MRTYIINLIARQRSYCQPHLAVLKQDSHYRLNLLRGLHMGYMGLHGIESHALRSATMSAVELLRIAVLPDT